MEFQIYKLLDYIKNNNKVPSCEELKITQDSELLLDKKYVFVNILGQIQSDENADMGITSLGYDFLKNNNPVGKVID